MACERQEQVIDLAKMRLDLDHTLDKLVMHMNLLKAGVQEAQKANVAVTLSLPFTKTALTKLHIHRQGTTAKPTAHASTSPAAIVSKHVDKKHDHQSDNLSIAASSDGSTAVSHLDGSWTYINSPQSEHSSFVLLPSQASSVADERVSANDDFSPHLQPGTIPAEVESSPLSQVQGIGSWLNEVCAFDSQSLLLPQHASNEGESCLENMRIDFESDLDMLLLHDRAMQSGGLMAGHNTGTMFPASSGVRFAPTAEVTDLNLVTGTYWELPRSLRNEDPWTYLCVVGA